MSTFLSNQNSDFLYNILKESVLAKKNIKIDDNYKSTLNTIMSQINAKFPNRPIKELNKITLSNIYKIVVNNNTNQSINRNIDTSNLLNRNKNIMPRPSFFNNKNNSTENNNMQNLNNMHNTNNNSQDIMKPIFTNKKDSQNLENLYEQIQKERGFPNNAMQSQMQQRQMPPNEMMQQRQMPPNEMMQQRQMQQQRQMPPNEMMQQRQMQQQRQMPPDEMMQQMQQQRQMQQQWQMPPDEMMQQMQQQRQMPPDEMMQQRQMQQQPQMQQQQQMVLNNSKEEQHLTESNIEKLINERDKLFSTTRNKSDNTVQNIRDEFYTNKNEIIAGDINMNIYKLKNKISENNNQMPNNSNLMNNQMPNNSNLMNNQIPNNTNLMNNQMPNNSNLMNNQMPNNKNDDIHNEILNTKKEMGSMDKNTITISPNNEIIQLDEYKQNIMKEIRENEDKLNNKILLFNKEINLIKNEIEQKNKNLNEKEIELNEKEISIRELENNIKNKNNLMYDTILNYCNKKDKDKSIHSLIIDSRTRDYNKYKNSNSYKIKLDNIYNNIEFIELINYEFTNKPLLINNTNNSFMIEEDGIINNIKLFNKNYTDLELIEELKKNINLNTTNEYKIIYTNNQIEIKSDKVFKLNFSETNINDILGFQENIYQDKESYISDKPIYLENEKYLNLIISKNNLGKILFNYQTYAFQKLENLLNLNEIEIELYNYNNNLCDLSNSEHILHLKIHCNNSKCTDSIEELPTENDSNSSL